MKPFEGADLLKELERLVTTRTSRRVKDLSIELSPERVVLRGRASSYYVKQLAQQGVREALPFTFLENVIDVEGYALSPLARLKSALLTVPEVAARLRHRGDQGREPRGA